MTSSWEVRVFHLFGFEHIAVAVGDLYFVDPAPHAGQEGPERGVRLEVRFLERGELHGSIYSAQPILVDRPIWRADLLESVAGPPGSFDRTHHHPHFRAWEPGSRTFDREMTADPVGWVGSRLRDVAGLCVDAGMDPAAITAADADAVRAAVPEILDVVRRLLAAVRAGDLARVPSDESLDQARAGWL